MLLSRVANSLYWMGRYLERAENINRHLLVACQFSVELEGISDEVARVEWRSLMESMWTPGAEAVSDDPDEALRHLVSYLLDKDNPYSVISSLGKTRDNARTVTETLAAEVTYNLNEAYRRLGAVRRDNVSDLGIVQDLLTRTHNSILTTLGAIEHSLTRGEGWNRMKLGEALERTQRTTFVLRSRLPSLMKHGDDESPLHFASWRSLLRSLASLENFRQEHGPRFLAPNVTGFLLFHPSAPRSVYCGIKRMQGYLHGMPDEGPGIHESRRRLGKLAAQLQFDDVEIMSDEALFPFLDTSLMTLYGVHEAVSNPSGVR